MSPQARPKGEFPFGGTALGAKSVLIRQCRDTPSYPYPGIRPFREDEEFLFFGREAQVDAMVDTLARQRFLTVIGSSGCGKSSLVNCGLRPALHRGLLTRAGSAWRMATCRPGGHPLRALAEALARSGTLLRDQPGGPFSQAELIEATLAMSRLGLVEAYRQAGLPQGTNLLVVVDQFEELFRYRALADADAEDGDPATAFVNLLLEARAHDAPIHIVLTMRSDFLGDCARFGGLPEAINSGQYLVPRMSRDERRAAILGPARVFDAGIAPTLLTRLVNDVGDDPDQLSLLQHALARTWAHWQAAGDASPIDAIHYDAIGTLAHALNQHAEETFAALPADRQRLSAAAFGALTDKRGRGVRRPTRFSDLCLITGSAADELAATLAPFRATGAAFLMPPEGDELEPDTIVDLAHESLMRLWNRLRGWGEREADAARMLHRLSDAAELHASGQASLWRDPELQFALDWRDRTHPTAVWARRYGRDLAPALAFLEASRAARDETRAAEIARAEAARRAESERRRNRQVLHLTLVTVVVAVLVAIGTVMLWQRAERAGEVAVSRQYAAQSATELAGGTLDRALLLAAAAFHRQPSFEARDSLLAALAQAPQDWQVAGQQGVSALAHSPDGRLVASGGNDGSVKLWDWGSGEPIATLSGHREGVLALAFSPDGRRLASGSIDHTVVLWDLASRRSVATLADHEGPVLALAFGADNILASAGADRRIVLRDGLTGAPRGPALDGHRETVSGLAFSPDGRTLASVDYSGTLFLWAPGQATTPRLRASHPAILRGVAFSPDGAILATASADGHVLLWHTHNLALKDQPLSGHDRPVRNLAFSPDGRYLVSVGEDRQVLAHDLARPGAAVPGRIGHRSEVVAVVFGYDGQFFTGGTDDLLIRHDAARHGPFAVRLPELDGTVWAMAFSPDGRNLATAGQDARIRLRDARSGVPQGPERSGHEALVTSLAFSPDGLLLASAGQDGRLLLWNTADSSALPRELQRGGVPLRRAVFSPDGRSLAAAGRDGQIRLWALPDGTPLSVAPKHGGPVADLAWSPDGKLLASAGFDGHIRLWNAEDGQSAGQLARPDAGILYRVAWAADGQHIAIASQKQGLLLWHRQSEQALSSGKDASILLDLAFSPDGHVLATADKDGTVRLWDVATYQSLREPLLRQAGPVLALAWAPDGSRLASAGWDRGVVLSRTSPDDWAGLACDLVRHNPPAEGSVGCAQR